jgi:nitrogen fixation-related uncharacterized protein
LQVLLFLGHFIVLFKRWFSALVFLSDFDLAANDAPPAEKYFLFRSLTPTFYWWSIDSFRFGEKENPEERVLRAILRAYWFSGQVCKTKEADNNYV